MIVRVEGAIDRGSDSNARENDETGKHCRSYSW